MSIKNRTKYLLTSLIFISACSLLSAQFHEILGDSLLSEKERSILNYFGDLGLLPENIDFEKSEIFKDVYQKITQFELQENLKNQININGLDVRMEHFFFNGDSLLNSQSFAQNNHYSTIGMSTNVNIANTPVQVAGDIVLLNGKLDQRLSTARVNFDPRRYLDQWKEKYNPLKQFEEMFDSIKNPLALSLKDKEIFRTDYLYTIFQQAIAHPKFRAYAKETLIKNDSLFNSLNTLFQNKESIVNSVKGFDRKIGKEELMLADEISSLVGLEKEKQNLIDKIKTFNDSTFFKVEKMVQNVKKISYEVSRIEELKSKYDELWENKKDISYEALKSIKQKVSQYSEDINFDKYNDEFKKFITKQEKLKGIEQVLLYTKHLDLGFFSIDRSDQIANYLSLNGVRYAYENEKFSAEVAYGNQSLSTQFLPSFGSLLLNRHFGRRILYVNASLQSNEGLFSNSFSLLKVNEENNPEDSLFVLPKRNLVVGWSGEAKILDDISLKSDVAVSDLRFGNVDEDPLSSDDLAVSLSTVYEPDSERPVRIEAGYFFNGENYTSLANPFLLTNRQGISITAGLDLLENKLTIQGDLKISKSLSEKDRFSDFQYLGEISYRFGEGNFLSARFLPNIFKQEVNSNDDIVANNNIYNIQANFQSKIKENKLFSIINLTNLRSDIQQLDTISLDARSYVYLQEILMLEKGNSINLTFMSGVKNFSPNALTDFLFQLDGTMQFEKWSFNLGSQLVKQQFIEDWQYGIVNRIQMKIFGKGFLNVNTTFRRTLTQDEPKNSIQANVSMLYGIASFKKPKIKQQ